jgi:Ca2+-binding EF-hand superfamily protein
LCFACLGLAAGQEDAALGVAFNELDKDRNGYITRDELAQVFLLIACVAMNIPSKLILCAWCNYQLSPTASQALLKVAPNYTEAELDRVIYEVDRDQNGQIDFSEFRAMMLKQR